MAVGSTVKEHKSFSVDLFSDIKGSVPHTASCASGLLVAFQEKVQSCTCDVLFCFIIH
jgi:hypothetical protein